MDDIFYGEYLRPGRSENLPHCVFVNVIVCYLVILVIKLVLKNSAITTGAHGKFSGWGPHLLFTFALRIILMLLT